VSNLAKWNGTVWSALDNGLYFSGSSNIPFVRAICGYNGNIYAGGYFGNAGAGMTVSSIAKWNGSAWSQCGAGVGGTYPYVYSLGGYNGLYVGGSFTTAGGVSANKIAKWNDGSTVNIENNYFKNDFAIYPNPFTSQTIISFNDEQKNTTIKIMDIIGNEIKTIHFIGKQYVIEKGEMQKGVYFVQITDEKKNIANKKIIIQ
jgi:hypothetical protein